VLAATVLAVLRLTPLLWGVAALLALAVALVVRNGGIVDDKFTDSPPITKAL
jgi:hypothetical protein